MAKINLTVKQIADLAAFVGFNINVTDVDKDELDTEVVVEESENTPVSLDENRTAYYNHLAYFEDYPEEGVSGLGDEINEVKP